MDKSYFKLLRNKTGLSQSKFAQEFGIPVGTIHNWEQGISSPPDYVANMLTKLVTTYCYFDQMAKSV